MAVQHNINVFSQRNPIIGSGISSGISSGNPIHRVTLKYIECEPYPYLLSLHLFNLTNEKFVI